MLSRRTVTTLAISLLGLCAATPGCDGPGGDSGSTGTSSYVAEEPVEITVIGTSDLHGRLSTLPVLGGFLRVLRAKNPDGIVLVDAGDMFQGTLESNLNEGEAVIDAYKKLGYDAVAIGNHELDYGPVGEAATPRKDANEGPEGDPRGALKARALQAKGAFPLLAANMLENDHPFDWPNVAPSVIVTKRGVRVGIIGVTTMGTPKTTIAANVVGVRMKPLADAINKQGFELRKKGVPIVIVAAHAGGECTKMDDSADLSSCDASSEIFETARAIHKGMVQAIVAGHTHKSIAHVVNGIPIIQSNAYGTLFGRVDLKVEPKNGAVMGWKIHPPQPVARGTVFEGTTIEPEREVEKAIAPAIERAKARRAESLGVTIDAPFPAKYRDECALGNMVTSLLLQLDPKADIAVANGGGLRADIAAGPLSYGGLYDAFPFDNRLATMTMTGRAFRETVTRNLTGKSGILSIAGARVEGRCDGGQLAVSIFLVKPNSKVERKVKDDDRIRILTNEFLATSGDGFGPGEDVKIDEAGPPFREPVAGLLKKRGGEMKADDWLVPGKPRIQLPGPIGPDICAGK